MECNSVISKRFYYNFRNSAFNLGVDISLIPIGQHIGFALVKNKKLWLIIIFNFVYRNFYNDGGA